MTSTYARVSPRAMRAYLFLHAPAGHDLLDTKHTYAMLKIACNLEGMKMEIAHIETARAAIQKPVTNISQEDRRNVGVFLLHRWGTTGTRYRFFRDALLRDATLGQDEQAERIWKNHEAIVKALADFVKGEALPTELAEVIDLYLDRWQQQIESEEEEYARFVARLNQHGADGS